MIAIDDFTLGGKLQNIFMKAMRGHIVPAKVYTQDGAIKELFKQKIIAKRKQEKKSRLNELDKKLPGWFSRVIKPIVSVSHDLIETRDGFVGKVGEVKVAGSLYLMLPSDCVLINDVVLEPEPDEFVQLDHVIVAPGGVYLVETKSWQGAILCKKGAWMRKEGTSWKRVRSPISQNLRHKALFKSWVYRKVSGLPNGDWIYPAVVFTRASWLKVDGSPMPVYDGCLSMAWHIRRSSSYEVLQESDRQRITRAILKAKPLPENKHLRISNRSCDIEPVSFREGQTRQGRRYVRVYGTRKQAEKVRNQYASKGFSPTKVRSDRSESGVWFFYLK